LPTSRVRGLQIYAHFQSEFSFLKANLMAVASIVAIFPVNARMQLDDPIQVLRASSPAVTSSQYEPRNRGIER
jgi:hypothetical protein